jgi:hypothetical protein
MSSSIIVWPLVNVKHRLTWRILQELIEILNPKSKKCCSFLSGFNNRNMLSSGEIYG